MQNTNAFYTETDSFSSVTFPLALHSPISASAECVTSEPAGFSDEAITEVPNAPYTETDSLLTVCSPQHNIRN